MKRRLAKVLLIATVVPLISYWCGYLFSHTIVSPCPYVGAAYYCSVALVGLLAAIALCGIFLLLYRLFDYIKNG